MSTKAPTQEKVTVERGDDEQKYTIINHFKDLRKGMYKWRDLSEYQQSTFSPYLVNLFLSQNPDLIEVLNFFQPQVESPDTPMANIYNLYTKIVPMMDDTAFYAYIKREKQLEAIQPLVDDLADFLQCSRDEAYSYVMEHLPNNQPKSDYNITDVLCLELMKLYGHDDKDIKNVNDALSALLLTDEQKKQRMKETVKRRKAKKK